MNQSSCLQCSAMLALFAHRTGSHQLRVQEVQKTGEGIPFSWWIGQYLSQWRIWPSLPVLNTAVRHGLRTEWSATAYQLPQLQFAYPQSCPPTWSGLHASQYRTANAQREALSQVLDVPSSFSLGATPFCCSAVVLGMFTVIGDLFDNGFVWTTRLWGSIRLKPEVLKVDVGL